MTQLSQWLLERLSWVPPVGRQGRFLEGLIAQTEPPVNGKLRQLLASAVWAGAERPPEVAAAEMPLVLDVVCRPMAGEAAAYGTAGGAQELQGRLYVAQTRNADDRQRRAVFVPAWTGEHEATLVLRGATWDAAEGRCLYDQIIVPVPLYLDPHLVLDATLRYVAYTAGGASVEVPSVTVLEIDWDRLEDRTNRVLQTHTRAVVTVDAQQPDAPGSALRQVAQAAGSARVAVVPSWRAPAGRVLAVGEAGWRMVSPTALRLPVAADDPRFVPLVEAGAESRCGALAQPGGEQPGFARRVFEHDGRCFHIARGSAEGEAPAGGPTSAREQVLVAVYEKPVAGGAASRGADAPPAPVASLSPFGRLAESDRQWLVGVQGDYAGWLAVRGADASGKPRLLGLPWSTCALWRLGRELHAKAQASDSAVEPSVCADR